MTSYWPCKKNDTNGYIFYVGLASQADTKLLQANPTLAAGDVKIAKDDGEPVNLASIPVVDADFTKRVKVVLSQAETNADNITIIFSDAADSEWCDQIHNIQTSAQTLDGVVAVIDALQDPTLAQIADAVWDEVLTGATHNVATSAGRRLRAIEDVEVSHEGTCQIGAGGAGYVKLDAVEASSVDQFYFHDLIILIEGTGVGQERHIDAYVGSTKIATVNRDWSTEPDATTKYVIKFDSPKHVHCFEPAALALMNAEMVDVLGTDTLTELSQAAPAATPTIKAALMLLYMIARNKLTTTNTELGIHNNAGTKIIKKVLEDDGVTYEEDKMESGE